MNPFNFTFHKLKKNVSFGIQIIFLIPGYHFIDKNIFPNVGSFVTKNYLFGYRVPNNVTCFDTNAGNWLILLGTPLTSFIAVRRLF